MQISTKRKPWRNNYDGNRREINLSCQVKVPDENIADENKQNYQTNKNGDLIIVNLKKQILWFFKKMKPLYRWTLGVCCPLLAALYQEIMYLKTLHGEVVFCLSFYPPYHHFSQSLYGWMGSQNGAPFWHKGLR